MHDLEANVEELQHANQELGMRGVPFFPATGVHLNLGAKSYWQVYAEAGALGFPVVVHAVGASGSGLE